MRQWPFDSSPRSAAKQADESKRGQQSQSTDPSAPTIAAVCRSPTIAYSSILLGIGTPSPSGSVSPFSNSLPKSDAALNGEASGAETDAGAQGFYRPLRRARGFPLFWTVREPPLHRPFVCEPRVFTT